MKGLAIKLFIIISVLAFELNAQTAEEVLISREDIEIEAALRLYGLSHAKNDLEALLGPADVIQESTHPMLDVKWEMKYGNSVFYLRDSLSDSWVDYFEINNTICTVYVKDLGLRVGDSMAAVYAAYPSQVQNYAVGVISNHRYITFKLSGDNPDHTGLSVFWDPNTLLITKILFSYNPI